MKIKKIIEIPEQIIPAFKKETEEYICDKCDEKAIKKCGFCRSDVCKQHLVSNYDYGDYPDYYCTDCYELKFKKYKNIYDKIENDYENEIIRLDNLIISESLSLKNKGENNRN